MDASQCRCASHYLIRSRPIGEAAYDHHWHPAPEKDLRVLIETELQALLRLYLKFVLSLLSHCLQTEPSIEIKEKVICMIKSKTYQTR